MKKRATTIVENTRREIGVTRDEYALCAYVQFRTADPRSINPGWCPDTREEIADFVGISRKGLFKMAARMEQKDLLEVSPKGLLRVTAKWMDLDTTWEQSTPKQKPKAKKARVLSTQGDGNLVPIEGELSTHDNGNLVPEVNKEDISKSKEELSKIGAKAPNTATIGVKEKKEKKPSTRAAAPATFTYQMREVFERHYQDLFADELFDWQQKEWKGLKEIGIKLKTRLTQKQMPDGEADILNSFDQFLTLAARCDKWTVTNGFTPSRLNGNYQSIIQKIIAQNGKASSNLPKSERNRQELRDLVAANTAAYYAEMYGEVGAAAG